MRGRSLVVLLVVVALAVAGGWTWWTISDARENQKKAEMELGLVSGRVLSATFVAARRLHVGTVSGDIVVRSDDGKWLKNSQFTRAPATIDYFVDLKNVGPDAFRWNEADRVMSVDLPDITIGKPNIDLAKAKIKQNGIWISRESGQRLQQQAVVRLNTQANEAASRAANVQKARDNARRAVEDFVRLPLKAAGLGSIRIVVRFPDEAKPRNISSQDWDVSKPIGEVLAEAADNLTAAR